MMRPLLSLVLILLATLAAGCAKLDLAGEVATPLVQPRLSPDSVVLEIIHVRMSADDHAAHAAMWAQIDEQAIDASTRRLLTENGFRVGLTGSQMPPAMQQLLRLESGPPIAPAQSVVTLDEEPKVNRRRLQVRSGRRSEIVTSGVYDHWPMLLRDRGELLGRTFDEGQGLWAVRAFPGGDGRVRLELIPELQHGEPRQTWRGADETFLLETSRPAEVLKQFRVETTLSPGQMLVLAGLDGNPGSLGSQFFRDPAGNPSERKLVIVQLAQTQADDLFEPDKAPGP